MKRMIHIGVGAFFRAHQAWYTWKASDRSNWEVVGFTGRSAEIAEVLAKQNFEYTLITRHRDRDELETIDILDAVFPAGDIEKLAMYVADEKTSVITLTITEAGYVADLSALESSALGRLALALASRATKTAQPIALVPCDNLPSNGDVLRRELMKFSQLLGPEFESYLLSSVDFISTSVDRITPKTTEREIDLVIAAGLTDKAPVETEPFSSWVLSGNFRSGRPHWESAGAKIVDDIEPYEKRKLWLLNGAHTLLANIGLSLNLSTVSEAVGNPVCRSALFSWWESAGQQLSSIANTDEYLANLIERFENSKVQHLLSQIAQDSLTKLSVRIAPVAIKELENGEVGPGIIETLATWISHQLNGPIFSDARQNEIDQALTSENPIESLLSLINPRLRSLGSVVEKVLLDKTATAGFTK